MISVLCMFFGVFVCDPQYSVDYVRIGLETPVALGLSNIHEYAMRGGMSFCRSSVIVDSAINVAIKSRNITKGDFDESNVRLLVRDKNNDVFMVDNLGRYIFRNGRGVLSRIRIKRLMEKISSGGTYEGNACTCYDSF